jgi:hypothetical protein
MRLHLTSIIPLVIGLVFISLWIVHHDLVCLASGSVFLIYGLAVTRENVKLIRQERHVRGRFNFHKLRTHN